MRTRRHRHDNECSDRRPGPPAAGGDDQQQPADVFVDLRDHRRPGEGDDVPLALPAGAARACSTARSSASPSTTGRSTHLASTPASRSRAPASRSTTQVFDRLRRAAVLRGRRLRRRRHVRAGRRRDQGRRAPGLLPGDPAVPVRHGGRRAWPRPGSPRTARVVVEKPFGHDLASARALADELHQYIDESQLYRIDHFLGKMGLEEILYLRFANTMLEPVWNRNYVESRADHHGRGLRRRGPRPLLRPGRRAARRRGQPPDAGGRRGRDGGARRRRPAHDQGRAGGPLPGGRRRPTRRTTCAASTTATATSTGVAPDSTTETYAALRLDIENWRWSGVPFFIRTGKRLPVTQTELRLVFKRPPRLGFGMHRTSGRTRTSSSSSSTRRPASGSILDAHRADHRRTGADRPRHGVRRARAARGRRRTRCCCTRRWSATAPGSPGRTASRRPGGSCSRCSTRRLRSTRTPRASWGPAAADALVAGHGGWHGPVDRVMSRRAARRRRPQSAAAPSPFPPIAEYALPLQLPHRRAGRARRLDRLAVRPVASTRPASSAPCSTGRRATSGSAPFGINAPGRPRVRARART